MTSVKGLVKPIICGLAKLRTGADRSPLAGLNDRDARLYEYDWSGFTAVEYGVHLTELLQLVCDDAPEAAAALARALEGAEFAFDTNLVMTEAVCGDAIRLIGSLRASFERVPKAPEAEWLAWSLEAMTAVLDRTSAVALSDEETRLCLRAARLACEGFCVGEQLARLRVSKAPQPIITQNSIH